MEPLKICVTDTIRVGVERKFPTKYAWFLQNTEGLEMVELTEEQVWLAKMAHAPSSVHVCTFSISQTA